MLTIITPTFNRAYILSACYNSLLEQTRKDFLWMVVDDGSTDNTETLINAWKKEKQIDIVYIKKENGGKASALNVAIDNLTTEYAVCLDSDDKFYPRTVEIALNELTSIKHNSNCCGILALRNNADGGVMGGRPIPDGYKYVSAIDIFMKLKIRGELICFYKSNILKNYRFPIFENEKFVSPAWMQYKVTENYKFKTVWEKLCECEYVSDGLTKNKRKVIVNNPKGYTCVKLLSFNNSTTLKMKLKHGIMYDYGCLLSKDWNFAQNANNKFLAIMLMPFAVIVYLLRKK